MWFLPFGGLCLIGLQTLFFRQLLFDRIWSFSDGHSLFNQLGNVQISYDSFLSNFRPLPHMTVF